MKLANLLDYADSSGEDVAVVAKKSTRKKNAGISLAFLKFIRRHEAELRSFHFTQAMIVYGTRWLEEHSAGIPGRITSYATDSGSPFRNIDWIPAELIAIAPNQIQLMALGAAVRLITVFENFLYDSIQRAVFLEPSCVEKFEINIDAQAIAGAVVGETPRAWFAHFVANKTVRSKAPRDLIAFTDRLLKAGVIGGLSSEVEEYCNWTLVRNAIAHLGGDVTQELAEKWSARFPTAGRPIVLTHAEILRLAFLSRKIAKALDLGQRPKASRLEDCDLFAEELFVRLGISDPNKLSCEVSKVLSFRMKRNRAEGLVAKVRKGLLVNAGLIITDEMVGSVSA